jgi:hypothetical protein
MVNTKYYLMNKKIEEAIEDERTEDGDVIVLYGKDYMQGTVEISKSVSIIGMRHFPFPYGHSLSGLKVKDVCIRVSFLLLWLPFSFVCV